MDTINIFENIIFELRDWYIQQKNISSEQFNNLNDFTILKILKLHFFVVAINSGTKDGLLNNNQFYAMPYGPVETNVYRFYKDNNGNFNNLFTISNENTYFENINNLPIINQELKLEIKSAITKLKELEPNLILAGAGSLVELTHTWNSWKKYYNLARRNGAYSELMPNQEIKKDNKIVNLNFIS